MCEIKAWLVAQFLNGHNHNAFSFLIDPDPEIMLAAVASITSFSIHIIPKLNWQHNRCLPLSASVLSRALGPLKSMVSSASSSTAANTNADNHNGAAYTTLREKVTFEKEIKKSKFIAIAGPISDERSAHFFLSEVADQYRSSDDGEPSSTAGKPIYSAIDYSGLDRVMVVVIRYFGGIKLGTGGLVRAYGGVTSECLSNAPTRLMKSKVQMGVEISFDLLGVLYHQLQLFHVEDINQDYETGKDNTTMVAFKVEFDQIEDLEDAIKSNCSRDITFYK